MERETWSPKLEFDFNILDEIEEDPQVDAIFNDFFRQINRGASVDLVDLTLDDDELPWNPPPPTAPQPQPPPPPPPQPIPRQHFSATVEPWKRPSSSLEDLVRPPKRTCSSLNHAGSSNSSNLSNLKLEDWLEYLDTLADWSVSILPQMTHFERECLHRERLSVFVNLYQERTVFDRFPWFSCANAADWYRNKYGYYF